MCEHKSTSSPPTKIICSLFSKDKHISIKQWKWILLIQNMAFPSFIPPLCFLKSFEILN